MPSLYVRKQWTGCLTSTPVEMWATAQGRLSVALYNSSQCELSHTGSSTIQQLSDATICLHMAPHGIIWPRIMGPCNHLHRDHPPAYCPPMYDRMIQPLGRTTIPVWTVGLGIVGPCNTPSVDGCYTHLSFVDLEIGPQVSRATRGCLIWALSE